MGRGHTVSAPLQAAHLVTFITTVKIAYELPSNLTCSLSDECLTMLFIIYSLRLTYVSTLPCNVARDKAATKELKVQEQVNYLCVE